MSLAIPNMVKQFSSLDANKEIKLWFEYSQDHDDFDRVQIIIENNDTLNKISETNYSTLYNEIYNHTFEDLTCKELNCIIIPSNKLSNGHTFLARVRIGAIKNGVVEWSNFSQRIIIQCYKPATAKINNTNAKIDKQYVDITASYIRAYDDNNFCLSDELNYYYCELYDIKDKLIYTTENHYTSKENNFKERINDLEDKNTYMVILYCVSKGGIVSTSNFYFSVSYKTKKSNAIIEAEYNVDKNSVDIKAASQQFTGLVIDDGCLNYIQSDYLYAGDKELDLTNGTCVKLQGGINNIDDDYTIQLWVRNVDNNKVFFLMTDEDNNSFELRRIGNNIYLYIKSFGLTNVYVSNNIKENDLVVDTDVIYISIVFDEFYNNVNLGVETK